MQHFRMLSQPPCQSLAAPSLGTAGLAYLANNKFEDNNEETVKLAFVMGLLSRIAAQLRATPKIETLDLKAVLQISRALMCEASRGNLFEEGVVARTCQSYPILAALSVEVYCTLP